MVLEARKLEAQKNLDLVVIQSVSNANAEYFSKVEEYFKARIPVDPEKLERIRKEAEESVLKGAELKNAMLSAFRTGRA